MNPTDPMPEFGAETIDALLRNDMASFVRAVFAEVSPGVELVWCDYLDLICARLAEVASGKTRRLIITIPPRHLKSICVSVALPAFVLGRDPTAKIMVVSYGQELAKTLAEQTRTVMASAFYERIFDTRLVNPRQSPIALATTAGGVRRATSIDGVATGVGANLMIYDDPQKPNEILSDAIRRSTNTAYENTFLSRRNDPTTCCEVIVMQRLHENDFVGHVLEMGGDWEILNLPAVAEADEAFPYTTFLGDFVFRRQEGEPLNPARVPAQELDRIRASMGEAVWASQYMQRPAPAGGGMVKAAWFQRYGSGDLPDAFDRIVQSWDTASSMAQWGDYSVCTTWGVKDKRRFLLDVYRKRMEFPDLKRAVVTRAEMFSANTVIVEDQSSGTALIQQLKHEGFTKIEGRKPTKAKPMRMAAEAAQIEAGFVYLPQEAHWVAEYLHELSVFPNGKYDDQVDSTSQALEAIGNPQMKAYAFYELARRRNEARGVVAKAPGAPAGNPLEWAVNSMEWTRQQAGEPQDDPQP
jgi:predicted phage terminase large subunit-like protein